jgi:hypothetical protein
LILLHWIKRICEEPKLLLDYRYYLMKLRFHLWPIIPKFAKKEISIFGIRLRIETDTLNGRGIYSYRSLKDLNERDLIKDQVKQNSICIDIGSNVGFYSIFLLKKKIAKKVYSFECNKKTFNLLLDNTKNLNCKQFEGEVGNKESQIIVDSVIDENDKIDFIKIDIDGLDYYALKSCEYIIDSYKPKILIEISESSVRYHNISFLDVVSFLKNKGYKCYYANKKLIEFDQTYLNKDEVKNIFFKFHN